MRTLPRQRSVAKTGFTLVEILVVIAILGVLAAILFPVLGLIRERGRQTACIGNLQQLYKAFAMYAQSHDGRLPPYSNNINQCVNGPRGDTKTYKLPERGRQLVQALLPYTKSKAIWFCPSDQLAGTNSQAGYLDRNFSSYHTPWRLSFQTVTTLWPLKLDNPWPLQPGAESHPLNVLLSDESWTAPITFSVDASGKTTRKDTPTIFSHNARWNGLFFDGHVKSLPLTAVDSISVCKVIVPPPIPLP